MSAPKEGVQFDDGKARWDLLPFDALDDVAQVLGYGARKYARCVLCPDASGARASQGRHRRQTGGTMSDYRSRAVPAARGPTKTPRMAAVITGADDYRISGPDDTCSATNYLRERFEALGVALTTQCVVRHQEPGELVSWANGRGITRQAMHAKAASIKAKRAMGERIARRFRAYVDAAVLAGEFSVVVLTRIAPRPLDSDNLETACKGVRDGIAAGLGIDDRDPRVRYLTTQERGTPRQQSVRAELFLSGRQGETP